MEPEIAQKGPYVQKVIPGTYAWCSCGKSRNQPLCDGSHEGTDFWPFVVNFDEEKTVAWCGCKHAREGYPFCDGTHSRL